MTPDDTHAIAELMGRLDERTGRTEAALVQLSGDVRQMIQGQQDHAVRMEKRLAANEAQAQKALDLATEHRKWFTVMVTALILAVLGGLLALLGIS